MSLTRFGMGQLLPAAALLVAVAAPASAQSVRVEFHDGRVTLSAQNAPIRTILAEWARVGGTTIVNGERVSGAPVTLELTNVPERQALDIVLRSVSGYMAGPRPVASAGTSAYDRIMIVPTSTPAPAGAARPIQQPPAFQPQPMPIPEIDPDDPEENPATDIPPDPEPEPAPQFPRRRFDGQGGFQGPPGFNPGQQPFSPPTQPDPPDEEPQDDPQATPATNPFGIQPGSARPGVITPVPQQAPNRPNQDQEP